MNQNFNNKEFVQYLFISASRVKFLSAYSQSRNKLHPFPQFLNLKIVFVLRFINPFSYLQALLNLPQFHAVDLHPKRKLVIDAALIFSTIINLESLMNFLKQSYLFGASLFSKAALFGFTAYSAEECSTVESPSHLLRMPYLVRHSHLVMHPHLVRNAY